MSASEQLSGDWLKRLEANRKELSELANAFEEEAGLHRPLAESVGDIITRDYEDVDFAQAISDRETSDTLIQLLHAAEGQLVVGDDQGVDPRVAGFQLIDGTVGRCHGAGPDRRAQPVNRV